MQITKAVLLLAGIGLIMTYDQTRPLFAAGVNPQINQLYLDILGRPADPQGAAYFSTMPLYQVRQALALSAEAGNNVATFPGYAKDPAAITALQNSLLNGATLSELRNEAVALRYDYRIIAAYHEILRRSPDPGGAAYLTGLLRAGVPEYGNPNAPDTDHYNGGIMVVDPGSPSIRAVLSYSQEFEQHVAGFCDPFAAQYDGASKDLATIRNYSMFQEIVKSDSLDPTLLICLVPSN